MKLVNNSDYSDIILKMANESYPAHRIIIKYRSSKLNDIIQKVRARRIFLIRLTGY